MQYRVRSSYAGQITPLTILFKLFYNNIRVACKNETAQYPWDGQIGNAGLNKLQLLSICFNNEWKSSAMWFFTRRLNGAKTPRCQHNLREELKIYTTGTHIKDKALFDELFIITYTGVENSYSNYICSWARLQDGRPLLTQSLCI